MADGLEDILRALADAGNFSHLSITASANGPWFHASFAPALTWGQGHATANDPVRAVLLAIENAPKGRKVHSPAQCLTTPAVVPAENTGSDASQGNQQSAKAVQANEPKPTSLMDLFKGD
jgi:hypothetical protein